MSGKPDPTVRSLLRAARAYQLAKLEFDIEKTEARKVDLELIGDELRRAAVRLTPGKTTDEKMVELSGRVQVAQDNLARMMGYAEYCGEVVYQGEDILDVVEIARERVESADAIVRSFERSINVAMVRMGLQTRVIGWVTEKDGFRVQLSNGMIITGGFDSVFRELTEVRDGSDILQDEGRREDAVLESGDDSGGH